MEFLNLVSNIDISQVAQSLSETTYAMARISDDLQDTIMKVRMVPVSSVFSRFPRLVRDLSRKSGKEVDLIMEGEETELDKSVVEAIGDPLVHLIRNSVDHGIEPEAVRIAAAHRAGDEVVAVLSAQAGATDALLARGREIDPDCAGREADSLLSTGEQVSVSLCALALARLGVPAVSLCGWQMGLQTDGSHGSARVLGLRGDRIERELRAGRVVLAAGFQGVDAAGDITTLGRGGSDTTAVALAAFLHADLCRIYTDVDGVYDRCRYCHAGKKYRRRL